MYLRSGAYYFVTPDGTWERLGYDLCTSMAEYAKRLGGAWSGRTLGDVIDRYRLEVLPLKSATTRKLEGKQLDRLKRVFGGMLPEQVTTQHLYQYMDGRRDNAGKPVPSAGAHEIALLRHVYAKAIRWGVARDNPAKGVEMPERARVARYATDADYLAVWTRAPKPIRVAMDLALLTGLRRKDILALTRSNITDEGITVSSTAKGGPGLTFVWTDKLREVIERAKGLKPQVPGTYLVRGRSGKGYTAAGFSAIWQRAVRRAVELDGIAAFTFHDIRRKSASDSASLAEAKDRLGHSSESVTRRFYAAKPIKVTPLR